MAARRIIEQPGRLLAVCIAVDLLDLFLGWFLGLGALADAIQTVVAVWLFGPTGLIAIWELAFPIDFLDGFVPTLTLLAIVHLRGRRRNRPRPVD
ncbi:MAG: hypothetical protein AAF668_14710 [Pseudomonadota bacterium]